MSKAKGLSLTVLLALLLANISIRAIYPPNNPISWDTFGYYLYLPSTFIYNDLGLDNKEVIEDIITKYKSTRTFYQVTKSDNGSWIMKYSMGMAFYYAPSFFIAHAVANIFDYPPDGFSKPYQKAIVINSILFFFLGMFFLRKALLWFFSDGITSLVLLLTFFGTNYLWYSTFSAEMPHNYLFTVYAFILWQTIVWHNSHKIRNIILLAAAIGFNTLARPTELIAILIPLLWGVSNKHDLYKKYELLLKYKYQLFWFVITILSIGSLQVLYWRIYSGHFIYYSYVNPGEGFEFLWPYTLKVLFSFRKGWLIYTPIMIFSILGLIYMYKKKRGIFIPIFIFFIINLYVVSSWSCWWYAQSFGQRALVQSYAIMAFPLGFFLTGISKKSISVKIVISILILFFVMLNLFQSWQFTKNIISGDRMTKLSYINSFGKIKHNQANDKLLLVDRRYKGTESIPENQDINHSVLKVFDYDSVTEDKKEYYSDLHFRSGSYSFMMDSTIHFSPGYKIAFDKLTHKDYAWIRASVWVYPVHPLDETESLLIVSFQHKGGNYKYVSLNLNNPEYKNKLILNTWNKVSIDYLTPEVRSKSDNLIIYIWNRGKKDIYFDDLTIDLYEPKE